MYKIILFLIIENSGICCPILIFNKYGQGYRSHVIGISC